MEYEDEEIWLMAKIEELQKQQAALENAPAYAAVGVAKKAGVLMLEVVTELARREVCRNEF